LRVIGLGAGEAETRELSEAISAITANIRRELDSDKK
jgi:hypothetical protein